MPPAAIAVLRISGPEAGAALTALAGKLPPPRRAMLRQLRDPSTAEVLDKALLLWFPGPATATGEDLAEIHAHGGRGVVRALEATLARLPGLRSAQPGEFTRRALVNGRIDLAEAEGLADLLSAETDSQRKAALSLAGGALSSQVLDWQEQLLMLSARVEALLDFADEDDVAADDTEVERIVRQIQIVGADLSRWTMLPEAERLRDGITVAIAGPPNVGKSTLLNALARREAAIVSPQAGTTRDVIEVPLALDGIPFRFADTAGLHGGTGDAIEAIGMERARNWLNVADMVLWLGDPADAPRRANVCLVAGQSDRRSADADWPAHAAQVDVVLSAVSGDGMEALHRWLVSRARQFIPGDGEVAINRRHRAALDLARAALADCSTDPLILAEALRAARLAIDSITGTAGTEAMLDALFGRFCIGK